MRNTTKSMRVRHMASGPLIAGPISAIQQFLFGQEAESLIEISQILRPIGGAFEVGSNASYTEVDDSIVQPDLTTDGNVQTWSANGISLFPTLEFELPTGPISILRVWLLIKASGVNCQVDSYSANINGSKGPELITPIDILGSYTWINFDITDGWAEITSLKLEPGVSVEIEAAITLEAIYIEAIP